MLKKFMANWVLNSDRRLNQNINLQLDYLQIYIGTCSTHTDSYLCTDLYSLCTYLWYACIYALTETSSQASDLFRTDSLTGMKSDKPRTC